MQGRFGTRKGMSTVEHGIGGRETEERNGSSIAGIELEEGLVFSYFLVA